VRVPENADIEIEMSADNWAFGRILGAPRL